MPSASIQFSLFIFVFVLSILRSVLSEASYNQSSPANVLLEKYWWKNSTQHVEATTLAYNFPTATWSAAAYEERKKLIRPETSKLYLFKPSPFLKPPFTEGDVGASISGIEDGVDIMGRRSGKPKRISSDRRIGVEHRKESREQEVTDNSSLDTKQLDRFLEHSLGKYLRSSNLSEIFGHISIDTFSEALKRVLEEKRSTLPPYDRNKELRRKFRDEVVFHKKSDNAVMLNGGLREKQYQKRLQKTWEIIKEHPIQQKTVATSNKMSELTAEENSTGFDDYEATYPTITEDLSMKQTTSATPLFKSADDSFESSMMITTPTTPKKPNELWNDETNNRNFLNRVYSTRVTNKEPSPNLTREICRECANPQDLKVGSYARIDKIASESIWGELSESSKARSKVRIFTDGSGTTTETGVARSRLKMPTKMYRGRTKYRDTVSNALDNNVNGDYDEIKLTVAESSYYNRPNLSPVNTFTDGEEARGAIPGQPGRDYPVYSSPPWGTGFRCPRLAETQQKIMADRSTRCQVFYICKGTEPASPGLCPNGTVFNEDVLVCDWWYNVDC